MYSETCVRKPPLSLALMVDVERWLSYKGTCHVILLAKLHDMYLYVTGEKMEITFFPNRGSNPVCWTQSATLYRVAIKAGLYRKAVQVCYISILDDIYKADTFSTSTTT